MWLPAVLLVVSQLLSPTVAAICPKSCHCSTTRDGLHRAVCSNLIDLYKFSVRQRHHNINILDLSHNNITKISHELDRLTEVVTLDLSTNGIQNINKFLHNSKKLVHLSLAHNRIEKLSFTYLPTSISSLDLTNNLLKNVPEDISHLSHLEHLQMEGNPLDCSCDNIVARNKLLAENVYIDNVTCASPAKLKGQSWLELKTKDLCKIPNPLDMMMGDAPVDAVQVGRDAEELKSTHSEASNDLGDSEIIQSSDINEDDDSKQFIRAYSTPSSPLSEFEGSGDIESTTIAEYKSSHDLMHSKIMTDEEMIPAGEVYTTEDPLEEGSGEGSGFLPSFTDSPYLEKDTERNEETTTEAYIPLVPGPVQRIFNEDNQASTEFPIPPPPSVYKGGADWNSEESSPPSTEKISTSSTARDTTVSEQIRVTQASEVLGQPTAPENVTPHKTGTYVCIAIIVVLLVGLVGFAIIKSQMRKRRDRRLLRQQKRDVEKASKEMVDMNKSLLGKPAPIEDPVEKKVNGKYELVPTHEVHQKKGENGDVSNGNGINHQEPNGVRTDSPRDTNQNKSSSKDNNLKNDVSHQETSFDSAPASPDIPKDTHSLSSEDIFVPMIDDVHKKYNSNLDSDVSQPLINGDQNTDSDFLSPTSEYVPVYSPDMGRVRIKMTETPKPKTPILVTRSRSNAGDIIITPDESPRKSTT